MLKLQHGNRFKRDLYRMIQRGHSANKLAEVLSYLVNEIPLPPKYRDHKLQGEYAGYRECHIEPDWLLIYRVKQDVLTLVLSRTGSHDDLF